jgi:hypothetical protein
MYYSGTEPCPWGEVILHNRRRYDSIASPRNIAVTMKQRQGAMPHGVLFARSDTYITFWEPTKHGGSRFQYYTEYKPRSTSKPSPP